MNDLSEGGGVLEYAKFMTMIVSGKYNYSYLSRRFMMEPIELKLSDYGCKIQALLDLIKRKEISLAQSRAQAQIDKLEKNCYLKF